MQEHTDPTWFRRGATMPLTLLTELAASTVAHASRIHQPQAAIGLPTLFGCTQRLPSWATQSAIRLKGKIAPREAALFVQAKPPRLRHSRRQEPPARWQMEGQAQTRSCVSVQAQVDAPTPDGGSRPIARRSARLLARKRSENTSDRDLARYLRRSGWGRKHPDADTTLRHQMQ